MKTKKYLCICDYGQVRSVAMAWYIHGLNREEGRIKHLQYEAIAIGSITSSKKTMKMLKKWADVVIDVRKYIPKDLWNNPNNDILQYKVKEIWEKINELEEKEKGK
jgi:RNase adaptor protein for sRNA GlmZ degradation